MIFSGSKTQYGVHGPLFQRWFAWRPALLRDGSLAWLSVVAVRYVDLGRMEFEFQWERRRVDDPWVQQVGLRS